MPYGYISTPSFFCCITTPLHQVSISIAPSHIFPTSMVQCSCSSEFHVKNLIGITLAAVKIKMDCIEVQEKSVDIVPGEMDLEVTEKIDSCEKPTEAHTKFIVSRHNKPKKSNTQISPQDYICTNEDLSIIQFIKFVPSKTKIVAIGDAVLSGKDLACLTSDAFLDDDVLNVYIYCLNAQEHLRHRDGGNVHLDTTYISAILKRDGELDIDPSDYEHIIRPVYNYLQHDMVYIPVKIKDYHWYLGGVDAKKQAIQVLDSFGPAPGRRDLTLILKGLKKHLQIASRSTNLNIGQKWQNLNVISWPIIECSNQRVQNDGLFTVNYMEYFTGNEMTENVTQEDMTQFRQKLAVILHDSELNRLKGYPEYEEVVDITNSSEDTNEQSPSKHIIPLESTNGLIKDESSLSILLARIVLENSHELVAKLCKYIMSIDDVKCLEKEWVLSSNPYPISISLKNIQDILKIDQAMDRKSFNMAVRISACDDLEMLKDTPDHYMDLNFCTMVPEYARDPKLRIVPDIQSLAKLLHSWLGPVYKISSCDWIILTYARLDHYILFVMNQHAKTISILDCLGISVGSVELKMIQDLRYELKLQRISLSEPSTQSSKSRMEG